MRKVRSFQNKSQLRAFVKRDGKDRNALRWKFFPSIEMYAIPLNEPVSSFTSSLVASFVARCNYRVNQSEDQRCRFPGSRHHESAGFRYSSLFFHYSSYNPPRVSCFACARTRSNYSWKVVHCHNSISFFFPSFFFSFVLFHIFTSDLSRMPRTSKFIYSNVRSERNSDSVFKI